MIINEKSPLIKDKAENIAKKIYKDLIFDKGSIYLKASGSSMYPLLKDGDMLKLVPVKRDQIKFGDIVAVDNIEDKKGLFYVHRVINIIRARKATIIITKGDANREGIDRPVGFRRIIGKLSQIERKGLKINFEHPLWEKYINRFLAWVSMKRRRVIRGITYYSMIIIEFTWIHLRFKKSEITSVR